MARKNLLSSVTAPRPDDAAPQVKSSEARADYARRGASRSMMQTLDEMAENSMRLLEGEAIVQLDPTLLDPSPFRDRIGENEEAFQALLSAIREVGQSSPILVHPHPETEGRYVIVYGHRRAKVARELGTTVRAVIKTLSDIKLRVISQGQENTARDDLTFIEKARFAKDLLDSGAFTKEDVKKALTIDDTLLSRMLAVTEHIPTSVLDILGAAKGVGRDRWEELKKILLHPDKTARAIELAEGGGLEQLAEDERFPALMDALSKRKTKKQTPDRPAQRNWSLAKNSVKVTTKDAGRSFTLAVKAKDASGFGAYLSENLERLYEEFQERGVEQEKR
ncbi:MAG: plasmid partitioning protein RepB [Sphingobium sp.]